MPGVLGRRLTFRYSIGSRYLVATADKMIPPPAQQSMAKRAGATVTEAEGSHAIFVSKPDVVASVIERAAAATSAQSR
jgi:hypothetical protein